jgi:membrane-bound lytic murein transglycosylase D
MEKFFLMAALTNLRPALAALLLAATLAGCATTTSTTTPSASPSSSEAPSASAPSAAPVVDAGKPQATSPALISNPILSNPSAAMQAASAGQANSRIVAPLTPASDMWERIRRGFAMPDLSSELVNNQEQWYATRPEYIGRMTERSRKYLFHIVEELERRNMPTELALLPFIESAFNPTAISSAKASGIWQFMPSTGRYFDLKQNAFRDDRRDVQASTRAALDYLQKLHRMFGDWHLALAAYNWGEGSVGRAIAKNKAAGLGTAYTDLNMPRETQFYVPKLQAVKNIVANPQQFKATLPDIANHPYFQSVNVTRDIDVALASKLAEVKLDDFKSLNPSANKPVILASGTPQILLPWDNAAVFESNLAAHKGQLASWTTWTAPSTLKVGDAAKRVGMSESELRSINNIPPKMLIKQGSTLLVPRSVRVEKDVPLHVADNGQVSLAPEIVLRKTSVRAGKSDSVASIAKRYALSVASVAQWNNVSAGAGFRKGQAVVVYLPVKAKVVKSKRR